jgi:eukaryotic-like serine/threonine-protein kinase
MPSVEELERVLRLHTDADVTQTFDRFRGRTGSDDAKEFVRYLVGEGLLAPDAARAVQAELAAARNEVPTVIMPRGDERSSMGTSPDTSPDTSLARGDPWRSAPPGYLLETVLGRGGMGTVYRARQVELDRAVAFKQLSDDDDDPERRERFLREARITAQLDHPHIVPVHVLEVSADGRTIGYAMKLVEGKTLRALLRETAKLYDAHQPIDQAHALPTRLEHFLKICDAIAFAHDRGILHRDIKPPNIMIGRFNEVYVMDWGVARPMGSAQHSAGASAPQPAAGEPEPTQIGGPELTQVGQVVGSPTYMSPEQAQGDNRQLDARSDQYALGLILFEVVSLRRALLGESSDEVLARARRGERNALVHHAPRETIPLELRAIIDKATAFAPADRYPSVAALAEDVRRYLRGEAVLARPDRPLQKLGRLMSRHRRATLLAFLAVLAVAAVTVSWTLYRKKAGELAARVRGERITALFIEVSAQAHRIDAQFQRMQQALEGLRSAAEWALTGPEPPAEPGPLFFAADFADPTRRPPDFTTATAYRWPVSVAEPVVGLSPGTSREAVAPKLRRLAPLRRHLRRMFLEAATGGHQPVSPGEERELMLQRRGPIDYAYVCLPEGVFFMLPGMDSLPAGYDVRTAGFYQISDHQHGPRWGSPYVDSTTDERGDDLVLPCTQGLWSSSGEFLGVAGVEITVTKMVETALLLPGRATLRTSLVDGEGKKVIDSGDAGKRFPASGKDEALVLHDFDRPEIVAAVRAGGAGVRELRTGKRQLLVLYAPLDVLGWYYVVEMDAAVVAGP